MWNMSKQISAVFRFMTRNFLYNNYQLLLATSRRNIKTISQQTLVITSLASFTNYPRKTKRCDAHNRSLGIAKYLIVRMIIRKFFHKFLGLCGKAAVLF
jgi:hypothetical protein